MRGSWSLMFWCQLVVVGLNGGLRLLHLNWMDQMSQGCKGKAPLPFQLIPTAHLIHLNLPLPPRLPNGHIRKDNPRPHIAHHQTKLIRVFGRTGWDVRSMYGLEVRTLALYLHLHPNIFYGRPIYLLGSPQAVPWPYLPYHGRTGPIFAPYFHLLSNFSKAFT